MKWLKVEIQGVMMSIIHFFLLSVSLGSIWVSIRDSDEIHRIAAILTGSIALIWIFCLTPIWVKLSVLMALLFGFFLV